MERLQQLNDELSVELHSCELQKANLSDKFRAELIKKEVSHYLFIALGFMLEVSLCCECNPLCTGRLCWLSISCFAYFIHKFLFIVVSFLVKM